MKTIITTTTTRIEYCKEHGWNSNTDLCMDVKTLLHNDRRTKLGKDYQGVLTRDTEGHYSFVETIGLTDGKRNPHVFFGKHITITRRDDGSYRLNFKPLKMNADFSVDIFAIEVYEELRNGLKGLIGK